MAAPQPDAQPATPAPAEAPAEAPPPAAVWVGATETLTRTIEGADGAPVEVEAGTAPVEYVQGVPARDLSEAEYAALTDEQRAAVEASGLYAVAGSAGAARSAAPAAQEGEGHAGTGR